MHMLFFIMTIQSPLKTVVSKYENRGLPNTRARNQSIHDLTEQGNRDYASINVASSQSVTNELGPLYYLANCFTPVPRLAGVMTIQDASLRLHSKHIPPWKPEILAKRRNVNNTTRHLQLVGWYLSGDGGLIHISPLNTFTPKGKHLSKINSQDFL